MRQKNLTYFTNCILAILEPPHSVMEMFITFLLLLAIHRTDFHMTSLLLGSLSIITIRQKANSRLELGAGKNHFLSYFSVRFLLKAETSNNTKDNTMVMVAISHHCWGSNIGWGMCEIHQRLVFMRWLC